MSKQPSPHDAVFHRALEKPVHAASQLRSVLPPALVRRLDLDQLALAPESFVDAVLRWRHGDLLFTTRLDGHDAYVYLLIEHQSSSDPLMALRMLRYVMRIWDRHLDLNPTATKLPAVIPLVVYHQRDHRQWNAPTQLLDLVDLDPDTAEATREYLPQFAFLLDDLTVVQEQALRARPLTPLARMTLLLLKITAGNPHLVADLSRWEDQLQAVLAGSVDDLVAVLTYIESVSDVPADDLRDLVAKLGPKAQEAHMTIAERYRTEGRVEGRTEGRVEGRVEALVQLLTAKFGPLPPAALDTLHAASTDQLETWTGRLLNATTLEEVLR